VGTPKRVAERRKCQIPSTRTRSPVPPRTPDELRRLNLEQDHAGGAIWPWIVGIAAVIFVVTLVYGYKASNSNTAGPPSLRSPTTTGSAPAATPRVNPLAATPSPAPAAPTDSPH
jgi:hypothetical protein